MPFVVLLWMLISAKGLRTDAAVAAAALFELDAEAESSIDDGNDEQEEEEEDVVFALERSAAPGTLPAAFEVTRAAGGGTFSLSSKDVIATAATCLCRQDGFDFSWGAPRWLTSWKTRIGSGRVFIIVNYAQHSSDSPKTNNQPLSEERYYRSVGTRSKKIFVVPWVVCNSLLLLSVPSLALHYGRAPPVDSTAPSLRAPTLRVATLNPLRPRRPLSQTPPTTLRLLASRAIPLQAPAMIALGTVSWTTPET